MTGHYNAYLNNMYFMYISQSKPNRIYFFLLSFTRLLSFTQMLKQPGVYFSTSRQPYTFIFFTPFLFIFTNSKDNLLHFTQA